MINNTVKKTQPLPQSFALPVIDVAGLYSAEVSERQAVGQDIMRACAEEGFFYIKGHGLCAAQTKTVFAEAKRFFDQTYDFKQQTSIEKSDRFQGYEPPTSRESKEAYVLGPERDESDPLVQQGVKYHGANLWPALPGWRDIMAARMRDMLELARLLNRGLALGLGIDESYFDHRSQDPMYAFRLLHYRPSPETVGIDNHTDWGSLSLLIQDDVPGLEIQRPDGSWLTVPPVPGTIVVNIGEMVERWTGGRLKATPHRVINRTESDRYSIAFFLDMDHDAVIETVPAFKSSAYDPIKVSDFIDLMHQRDYS